MNTIRVAIPGYDAETDTNLDHFALYTDQDNVLIKEKTRGSVDIISGGSQTIAHGLSYIPFFLAYAYGSTIVNTVATPGWLRLSSTAVSPSLYVSYADTTNITLINNDSVTRTFKYYIFYDNMVGNSGVKLVESENVIKVAKSGYDAKTEKDPNNLIFHSDLNTFKILYQGKITLAMTSADDWHSFAHNSPLPHSSSMVAFIQFPDGFVTPISYGGSPEAGSYNNAYLSSDSHSAGDAFWDDTTFYFRCAGVGTSYNVTVVWYIFETPLT